MIVFISHSGTDRARAELLVKYLEAHGHTCWASFRSQDMLPGVQWDQAITEAIDDSDTVILLLSKEADASPEVHREMHLANEAGLPIHLVRLADVERSNLRYLLSGIQRIDWFDGDTSLLDPLLHALAMGSVGGPVDLLVREKGNLAVPEQPPAAPTKPLYSEPALTSSYGRPGTRIIRYARAGRSWAATGVGEAAALTELTDSRVSPSEIVGGSLCASADGRLLARLSQAGLWLGAVGASADGLALFGRGGHIALPDSVARPGRLRAVANRGSSGVRAVIADDQHTHVVDFELEGAATSTTMLGPASSTAVLLTPDPWTVDLEARPMTVELETLTADLKRIDCLDASIVRGEVVLAATGPDLDDKPLLSVLRLSYPYLVPLSATTRRLDDWATTVGVARVPLRPGKPTVFVSAGVRMLVVLDPVGQA